MAASGAAASVGTRYVLLTECLQNDFFLNRECRLCVPDAVYMLADTLVVFDHARHHLLIIANAHIKDRSEEAVQAGREARRISARMEHVLELAGERAELAAPILPELPDLLAEAAFAARYEQARSVGDVLLRRTRLGLLAGRELSQPQSEAVARIAKAMADELGWDQRRVGREIDCFADEARAEGIGLQ